MMREIKFRGKVKYNGQHFFSGDFVEGYYAYKELDGKHIILVERPETTRHASYFVEIEVDAETIGQYTGLKDKNGVEIYEGDILACKFNLRYVERISWKGKPDAICTVFYDFNAFRLMAKGEEDERYADFFDFLDKMEYKNQMCDLSLRHTEVIGNIHDEKIS